MHPFALLFLAALLAATAVRVWLSLRHMQHVRAHRDQVPAAFAADIPAASHRTAADYTVAKGRVDLVEVPVDALVLLLLTFGGGLALIDDRLRPLLGDGLLQGVGLIGTVVVLTSLLSLPASLYRTFVIEQRFAHFEGVGHAGAVDLGEDVARQVSLVVQVLDQCDRIGEGLVRHSRAEHLGR
jgi:STE24 endopeptidase